MAVKAKKQTKETKSKSDFTKEASEMRDSAIKFLGEVEKSGEKLAMEVKHFFEQMADNAGAVASTAAKTTQSVTKKVAGTDPGQHLSRVMDEVKEAGETSMRALGEGFDALRQHILDLTPTTATRKKGTAKKKATKEKATKRKVVKKKATKKVAKKKPVTKKASKKKTTKKPIAKKKVVAKRVVKKRVAS